jgi:hypothetical protein
MWKSESEVMIVAADMTAILMLAQLWKDTEDIVVFKVSWWFHRKGSCSAE